jgi:hypothetical protein
MNYDLVNLLSYSVAIPALVSLFRIKSIDKTYYPFILVIWIGMINETTSSILIAHGHSNAINANVYSLLEAIIITKLFDNWGLFKNKRWFYGLIALFIVVWTGENFIFYTIKRFCSYFIILYSFSIVLMSISMVNRLIVSAKKSILSSAMFLICIAYIFFFTYAVLVEIFWIYGLGTQEEFSAHVFLIMIYINTFTNLLFAAAILWIPTKRKYILL